MHKVYLGSVMLSVLCVLEVKSVTHMEEREILTFECPTPCLEDVYIRLWVRDVAQGILD